MQGCACRQGMRRFPGAEHPAVLPPPRLEACACQLCLLLQRLSELALVLEMGVSRPMTGERTLAQCKEAEDRLRRGLAGVLFHATFGKKKRFKIGLRMETTFKKHGKGPLPVGSPLNSRIRCLLFPQVWPPEPLLHWFCRPSAGAFQMRNRVSLRYGAPYKHWETTAS